MKKVKIQFKQFEEKLTFKFFDSIKKQYEFFFSISSPK